MSFNVVIMLGFYFCLVSVPDSVLVNIPLYSLVYFLLPLLLIYLFVFVIKAVFFAGLESTLRHEIWPFLLHYYPYTSTFEQREQIRNDRYIDYQNIRKQRYVVDMLSLQYCTVQ